MHSLYTHLDLRSISLSLLSMIPKKMTLTRFSLVVFLLFGLFLERPVAARKSGTKMTREAQQILQEVLAALNFTMDDVKDAPVPAYRLDLPSSYVAFYIVELAKSILVTSAGEKTGDKQLLLETSPPSPITVMDKMAAENNKKCVKYYVLTYLGDMICKDKKQKIVGYAFIDKDLNINTTIEDLINSNKAHFKQMWDEREKLIEINRNDTKPEGKGQVTMIRPPKVSRSVREVPESFDVSPINPGRPVQVALGPKSKDLSVNIVYIPLLADSDDDEIQKQSKLCSVITNCEMKDGRGVISPSSFQKEKKIGNSYFMLEVDDNAQEVLGTAEVIFKVDLGREDLYYEIVYEPRRKRRAWSRFSYRWIYRWDRFPCYKQFPTYGSCKIGCGPVAWAMIFGWLDRANSRGSWPLYRDGHDGTYGRDIQAPDENDARMDNYIRVLARIMGISCGNAKPGDLDDVEGFYKARQIYRNPDIRTRINTWIFEWLGIRDSLDGWVRSYVNNGWATMVSIKKSFWSNWHLAVVIGTRRRSRRTRTCYGIFGCTSWKTENDDDYYLAMGYGCDKNAWYTTLNPWMAAVAVY